MYGSLVQNVRPSYPVSLRVEGRRCLVVGGGLVALRKAQGLVASGADVTIVAPEVCEPLRALDVGIHQRTYESGDVQGHRLVITCTNDPAVNAQVFQDAEAAGIWVNSADDLVNCSFTLPAVAWRGDLSIAVSTAGKSPAMASWLRKRFEVEFDQRYLDLLDLLATVRAEAKREIGTTEIPGWIESLEGGLLDTLAADASAAHQQLRSALGLDSAQLVDAS